MSDVTIAFSMANKGAMFAIELSFASDVTTYVYMGKGCGLEREYYHHSVI